MKIQFAAFVLVYIQREAMVCEMQPAFQAATLWRLDIKVEISLWSLFQPVAAYTEGYVKDLNRKREMSVNCDKVQYNC